MPSPQRLGVRARRARRRGHEPRSSTACSTTHRACRRVSPSRWPSRCARHRMGVGDRAGGQPRDRRRRRRGGRVGNRYSPQFVVSVITDDPDRVRTVLCRARRAVRRQRIHPLGRRAVRARSARNSASPIGRPVARSAAARSCQATASTRSATSPTSPTRRPTADDGRSGRRVGRSDPDAVDVDDDVGRSPTWSRRSLRRRESLTLAPLATGAASR